MINLPRLDWKIYSIVIGVLLLGMVLLFLEKVFFFFAISLATVLVAVALGFVYPVKYLGIELITLSTMLVGVVYGPVLGGVYGFTILLVHLILGRYYIGPYLMWVIPEYVLLGILSGVLGTRMIWIPGVSFIVGINVLNVVLTALIESDRFVKELPYAIGNIIINSFILIHFFNSIVNFID